ncbi:MAG: serine hydrolase domain-containing protein [Candidatus Binatia bacterium]
MSRSETIRARAAYVASRLESAARELLRRGIYAVAARLAVPGLDEPIRIAVGSVDSEGSAPLTGSELYAVASQSKMFTAACVLMLAREGAISLDDPVSKYVPDVPAVDEDATVAQFLNHTSGIGNFIHAMTVLPHPWPRMSYDDLMALARMHGRQFRAGERLDYNNTDVVVLARLCERVGGVTLAKLLSRRIFEPLGMRDTFVAQGDDWPRSRMARGYYMPSQGYEGPMIDVSTLADYSIASAAGNVVSSLPDMMRFARCLLGETSAIGLGTADFAAGVAEARVDASSWFFPRTYGRGVEAWCWAGRRFWGHRGSFFGYHSGTFVDPQSGVSFSMFLTICTAGTFLRFLDLQAHDYMAFLESCAHAALDVAELP